MTHTQVSGSEKTLLQAIRDEDIERPILMRWNAWLRWRSGNGKRPNLPRDGVTITNAEESAIWRSVMNDLYGDQWSVQLAAEDDDEAVSYTHLTLPTILLV